MSKVFSIIIPVYNVEDYIIECYESIKNQKFKNYEIILVNDGSTDKSGDLCDQIANKDCNVSVIHKINGGLSDARNVGILNAKGEYIILLDSDDMLENNSLENLYKSIIKYEYPDVLLNRIKRFSDEDGKREFKICEYKFSESMLLMDKADCFRSIIKNKDYIPGAWTVVSKKEYICKNNIFFVKGLIHEDEQWTPRVILQSKTIGFNNEVLYLYREKREGSITQSYNIESEFHKLWIIESLYNESKNSNYDIKSRYELIERASDLYWGILIRLSSYSQNKSRFKDLSYELKSKQYIFNMSKNNKYIICRMLMKVLKNTNVSIMLKNAIKISSVF